MESDVAAWIDEARQHQHDGELKLAAAIYRRVLQAQPAQIEAMTGLAEIFQARGNAIEAVALLEEGLKSSPDSASLLESLGDARHARGLLESAISAYREALDREPCRTGALWGMGCAQASLGDHAAAAESLRQLVELQPDYGQGHHNLGRSLYELGQVDQALEAFQRAFHALPPEARAVPLTNMAMVIPGSPAAGNREILECRRAWATQCLPSRPISKKFPDRDSHRDRPLRLGYVSSYFARRNWMKPVWGLLNHHDRESFEIHLFSDGPEPAIAEGYGRHPRDRIHETAGLSNEALAQLIEEVQIDLLVELNGYC
ncbi:MAG: tetratricopeptide repeat protein, partial [Planctomycetaceae bacterium]|nr:tetratricopeptide repeat protein [Planctomycetaceae bacterium]